MILILSNKFDITTDFVVSKLQDQEYPYTRLNTEDLHELDVATVLPNNSWIVETNDKRIHIAEEVGSIWNRRPRRVFDSSEREYEIGHGQLEFIRDQWDEWLRSLESISGITWVNRPSDNERMESKITQLRLAHELGFKIPSTVVTNSVSEVSNLSEQTDDLVAKALGDPFIETNEQNQFVYTSYLEELPQKGDKDLHLNPTIFQEALNPKTDYRVTVIGDTVLPVRIEGMNGKDVPLDWRRKKDNIQFVESELPKHIEKLCGNYVKNANLEFGAIDLADSGDEFFFLEINPNGEWGWLEKPWGIPIAENLTSYLMEKDQHD